VTCSALVVHIWDGRIEGHFHFFMVIPLLLLYQDWSPFLIAIGYVVVHHGVLGVLDPRSVFDHEGAAAEPWLWALVHGGFVVGASAASMVAWRANEQLLRDQLTGLPTRVVLLDRLADALERCRRHDSLVAAFFIDLDRFKVVNDSLGHHAGDELLSLLAERLRRAVRPSDTAARFGGDEFVVLCEQIADRAHAEAIADRLLEAMRVPISIEGREIVLTVSIGIAIADGDGEHGPAAVLRDADTAMYRAKQAGKNRSAVCDDVLREAAAGRLETEAELRQAVEQGQLELFFQPQVGLADGHVLAVEALLRWRHPTRGVLAPGAFLDLAEETGLSVRIGRWTIGEACRWVALWRRRHVLGLRVHVNVSARQLADPELESVVVAALIGYGLPPSALCLEVTETILSAQAEAHAPVLARLRKRGVRIAIDDFGTGQSSLERLGRLDADILKIDRAFVDGLTRGAAGIAIVRAIVEMAAALRLEVTAEGVETRDQLAQMQELCCDAAQGYLLARPAPVEEIGALLGRPADAVLSRRPPRLRSAHGDAR
jgi:diguanylate cyclase